MKIIHIVDVETWEKVKDQPQFFGDTLKSHGFIHCCLPGQVDSVLKNWFPERDDLIFLELDTEKLLAKLVFENLEGEEEKFPHIYGPINRDAIIAWYPSNKNRGC